MEPILSIAATVAKNTRDVVQNAIETVRTKDVLKWCRKKLGKPFQAKRKKALAIKIKQNKVGLAGEAALSIIFISPRQSI
jgi:23S rRNA C2498 (ribose-2'-O)-methylase RlmM